MDNGFTATQNLDAILNRVETKIANAATNRGKYLDQLNQGVSTPAAYEGIIFTDAEIRVYSNVRMIIENLRNSEVKMSDEDILDHVVRSVLRRALETHFVNSSSNIYVEIELRERFYWTELASHLNGF
jgi:hypothetical protein